MKFAARLAKETLAVFLFHGVTKQHVNAVRNYTRKHLSEDEFIGFLREIKEGGGNPVSFNDVMEAWAGQRTLPEMPYVITFDDGFENNYSIAAPILKDFQVPATFYITTDFVDQNHMSWIDRIELPMEATNAKTLHLPWETNERLIQCPEAKISALTEIRRYVKTHKDFDVETFISDVYHQTGIDEVFSSEDPLDRKMSWSQVRALNDDGDFIVGGHSHCHKILSFLSDSELVSDIDTSLKLLADKAGVAPDHYSYPEGLAHCYSDRVIAVLKERGVKCCPSAEDGVNRIGDDLFHLKRIMVP